MDIDLDPHRQTLATGQGVSVPGGSRMNGIDLQDRELFAAIREGRQPNSSVADVLPCYRVLHELEQQLGG